MLRHGVGLDEIVRFNAARGAYGPGDSEDFVAERVAALLYEDQPTRLRLFSSHRVIEIRSARLPDGGIVTTYTDVTQTVQTEEALEAANELLGKARRRAHRRVAAPQRRTRAREDGRGGSEPVEDALSRRREPRHSAAAQRRPALCQFAQRRRRARSAARSAPISPATSTSRWRRSRRFSARSSIFRGSTPGRPGRKSPTCRSPTSCGCWKSSSRRSRKSKGLELRFVPTKLAIRTDRRLMRRLLQNLVSNALKYTLKGRVLVGCRRAGRAVRIEVWDTGLGIPADRQRAVFEEFQRLDQGARVARGLGLGLSIVERLGRVLGHPLGLNSRPGEGSVFFVTAPIGDAAPPRAAPRAAPRLRLPSGEPLSGLKVLAIDNEPRVLEGMRLLMSRWGCVVATAHGLAEARRGARGLRRARRRHRRLSSRPGRRDRGDPRLARGSRPRRCPRSSPPPTAAWKCADAAAREDIIILNKPLKPAPFAGAAHPLRRDARGGGVGRGRRPPERLAGLADPGPAQEWPSFEICTRSKNSKGLDAKFCNLHVGRPIRGTLARGAGPGRALLLFACSKACVHS